MMEGMVRMKQIEGTSRTKECPKNADAKDKLEERGTLLQRI
jgi:hypothetical protein